MLHDWPIHARAERCALTDRAFADGETFHTLLYRDRHAAAAVASAGLLRLDVCESAWRGLRADPDAVPPFSHWRAKFVPPKRAEKPPDTLPRHDAETLLRRYLTEEETPADGSARERACYLLALVLERRRRLRPTDARTEPGPNGRRLLFYEHRETGETFVVVDPGLRLDQLEEVQREVADLLRPPPPPSPEPAAAGVAAQPRPEPAVTPSLPS